MITLISRKTFWKDFDDQIFLCTLNYGFLKLSPLFNENNILKAHLSNLNFSQDKLRLKKNYNRFLMIICKMTCGIQSILPSHYLRCVNLGNYGLPHVLKSVIP
jgi:hypothetical protein